jgi:hypothetical protein
MKIKRVYESYRLKRFVQKYCPVNALLLILCVVFVSCNQESECDNIRRNIESLTAKESELKGLPTYNGSKNMDLVRIASQKAFLKHKLNGCEF